MILKYGVFTDAGLLKEYDTPEKLMEDKSSSFSKLVAEYSMRSSSSIENLNTVSIRCISAAERHSTGMDLMMTMMKS